jgi:hypothetical protein
MPPASKNKQHNLNRTSGGRFAAKLMTHVTDASESSDTSDEYEASDPEPDASEGDDEWEGNESGLSEDEFGTEDQLKKSITILQSRNKTKETDPKIPPKAWKRSLASGIKSVEATLDGAIDRDGGAKEKIGKKRGLYKIGGDSERTARRKQAKLKEEFEQASFRKTETDEKRMEDTVSCIKARGEDTHLQYDLRVFMVPRSVHAQCVSLSGLVGQERDTEIISVPQTEELEARGIRSN